MQALTPHGARNTLGQVTKLEAAKRIGNEAIDAWESTIVHTQAQIDALNQTIQQLQQQAVERDPVAAQRQQLATQEAQLQQQLTTAASKMAAAADEQEGERLQDEVQQTMTELKRVKAQLKALPLAQDVMNVIAQLEAQVRDANKQREESEKQTNDLKSRMDEEKRQVNETTAQLRIQLDDAAAKLAQRNVAQGETAQGDVVQGDATTQTLFREENGVISIHLSCKPDADDARADTKRVEHAAKVLKELGTTTTYTPIFLARQLDHIVKSLELSPKVLIAAISQMGVEARTNIGIQTFEDYESVEKVEAAIARRLPTTTTRSFYAVSYAGDKPLEQYIKEREPMVTMLVALKYGVEKEFVRDLIYDSIPADGAYARDNKWLLDIVRKKQPTTCTQAISIINLELRRNGALKEQLTGRALPSMDSQKRYVAPGNKLAGMDQPDATQELIERWRNIECRACHARGHVPSYCPTCPRQQRVNAINKWNKRQLANKGTALPATITTTPPLASPAAPATPTATPPKPPTAIDGNWFYVPVSAKGTGLVTGGTAQGLAVAADISVNGHVLKRGTTIHLDTASLEWSLIHPDAVPLNVNREAVKVSMRGIGQSTVSEAVHLCIQHPTEAGTRFMDTFLIVPELPLQIVVGNKTLERVMWERRRSPNEIIMLDKAWPQPAVAMVSLHQQVGNPSLDTEQMAAIQHIANCGILDHVARIGRPIAIAETTTMEKTVEESEAKKAYNELSIPEKALDEETIQHLHAEIDDRLDNHMPMLQDRTDDLKEVVQQALHTTYFPVFRNELQGKPQQAQVVSYGLDPDTIHLTSVGPKIIRDPEQAARVQVQINKFIDNGILGRVRDLSGADQKRVKFNQLVIREAVDSSGKVIKTRLTYNLVALNDCIKGTPINTIQPVHLMFDRAAGAKCLGTMDECDSYFQFELDFDSQLLSGTWDPKGEPLFFKRMPQGYKFAPAILHEAKMRQYATIPQTNIAWIFDDTAIWTRGQSGDAVQEFWELLKQVLDTCLANGTVLKPKKFNMFQDTIKREGMIYTLEGMRRDPEAVNTIRGTPPPTSVSEVRGALGLIERYTKHIPAIRLLEAPLHEALCKGGWTSGTVEILAKAWSEIVDHMAIDMLRYYPDYSQPFLWHIDTSTVVGIAGVVGQMHNDIFQPIEFMSRRLKGAEPNMWATELEITGYRWAMIDKCPQYAERGKNIVIGDAKSLENWTRVSQTTENKVVKRAMMDLQHLQLEFVAAPREQLAGIDWLGRQNNKLCLTEEGHTVSGSEGIKSTAAVGAEGQTALAQATALVGIRVEGSSIPPDIQAAQATDPECCYIKMALENTVEGEDSKKLFASLPQKAKERMTAYRAQDPTFKRFILVDGVLMYTRPPPQMGVVIPYWPFILRTRIIMAAHNWAGAGHRGVNETRRQISEKVFWHGMGGDIKSHIQECQDCLRQKGGLQSYGGLSAVRLHNYRRLAYDLIGPLTTSTRGHKYWGVLLDMQSKFVWIKALRSKAGIGHATFIFNVMLQHGMAEQLQIDGAPDLVHGVMAELTRICNIHNFVTPAHVAIPNGDVERVNGTVGMLTRALSNKEHTDWPSARFFIMAAINNSYRASIQATPYSLEFSRDILFPLDKIAGTPSEDKDVQEIQRRTELARQWAAMSLEIAKEKMEERYNKDHVPFKGKEGEMVMIHWPRKVKLDPFWAGPYKLVAPIGEAKRLWTVAHPAYPKDTFAVHVNRLKLVAIATNGATMEDPEYVAWTRSALKDATTREEIEEAPPNTDVRTAEEIENGEWEVDTIVSHRDRIVGKGKTKEEFREYLVRFVGYSDEHNEWLPEEDLHATCPNAVREYLERETQHVGAKDRGPTKRKARKGPN